MKNKKLILVWIVIFFIFALGIITSINENKSISECKDIVQNIEKEAFNGIISEKPIVNKSTKLIIDSNIGVFRIYPCCPDLYYLSKIGDSIIKLKNTNIVKVRSSQDSVWTEYKYKFIPYSCGDLHPCDIKK